MNISLQGNTNYLGLPLCATLLGTEHLPQAIAYDSFVQAPVFLLGVFGVAAAMGTKAGGTTAERVKTFVFKNPVLLAVVAGLFAPALAGARRAGGRLARDRVRPRCRGASSARA